MAAVDDVTLGDIVTDNAMHFPDVVAYRDGHRGITHAQLRDRAVRLVSAMAAAGVKRQDRIAVLSRNGIEFGELNAAAQLSGIVMATISFRLSPPEMEDALRRLAPSIVFCAEEFVPVIADIATGMPSRPVLVTIEYRIDPARRKPFLTALDRLGHERRRDGAYAWGVFEDAADPARFVETFLVESWLDHLRQHERVTNADRVMQQHVQQFHLEGAPKVTHLIAAERD